MAQASAAGAGAAKQLIDVLPLTLAGELHQAQFGDLGDLRPGLVIPHGLGEMLQQHQLVAARLHIDEVDDHHAADVAQLQLTGNLGSGFTVGPQHRLAGIRRAGEGTGVHIHHREGLGGLDDHVATGGQIHPRLEGIADGRVDLVMLKDFAGILVVLNDQVGLIGAKEAIDARHRVLGIHHNPQHIGAVEITQHPMNEVFIAVQQNRRVGCFSGLLDRLPLAQQGFEVINDLLFTDAIGLSAHQQARAWGLDQHRQGPQPVALGFTADAPRHIHPLPMGLQHQKTTWQREVASEPRALGAGGLLHHLNQHLLARFQQLSDPSAAFLQAQRAEVGDVNETVFFALADVDESGIDAGEDVFNGAQIHITDLVTTLRND